MVIYKPWRKSNGPFPSTFKNNTVNIAPRNFEANILKRIYLFGEKKVKWGKLWKEKENITEEKRDNYRKSVVFGTLYVINSY